MRQRPSLIQCRIRPNRVDMNKPLTKILICYHARPPIGRYLESASNQRGIEVVHYHPDTNTWFDRHVIHFVNKQLHNLRLLKKGKWVLQKHPLSHMQHLQAELGKAYRQHRPDLFLAIRGTVFGHEVMQTMDCPKIGWWIESENRFPLAIEDAPYFDKYFCMSKTGVEQLASSGYSKAEYLGHAVDTDSFSKLPQANKTIDLCFVGNHCAKRQAMIEAALNVTKSIVIYGANWEKNDCKNPEILAALKGKYISGHTLNELYNRSKVVLNVTSWDGQSELRSGMNMRLFEVPATGSLLMTDEIREISDYFDEQRHLVVYRDTSDFQEKLKLMLEDDDRREQIANAGFDHVTTHYTYAESVDKIINAYNALK